MAGTHEKHTAIAESDERGARAVRWSLVHRFRGRSRKTDLEAAGRVAGFVEHAPDDEAVVDLDDRSFFDALDGHVSVIDFWAPWCGPCTQLHPLFEARAAEHSGAILRFGRVNVDDGPGAAAAFEVMSIPTIIVIDPDGHEVDREIGLPSKRRLDGLIRSAASIADEFTGSRTP